jgi:rod shape-determining protein MreC
MKRRNKKRFFLTLILLVLFFLIGYSGLFENNVKSWLGKLSASNYILAGGFWTGDERSFHDIYEENVTLKNKISFLEQRLVNLEKTIEDQFDFQNQIDFLENNNFEYKSAKIINRGFNQNKNIFILDKGKKDGAKKGLAVVSTYGTVLGKIIFVDENFSWLLLLNDKESSVSVSLLKNEIMAGSVEGGPDGNLLLRYVSKDCLLEKADILITSGIEEDVPSGLLVGEVATVQKDDRQIFSEALVWQASEIKNINFVNIVFP